MRFRTTTRPSRRCRASHGCGVACCSCRAPPSALINTPAWKKALIFKTTLAHLPEGGSRDAGEPAGSVERAVRRYEGAGTGAVMRLTMRDPQNFDRARGGSSHPRRSLRGHHGHDPKRVRRPVSCAADTATICSAAPEKRHKPRGRGHRSSALRRGPRRPRPLRRSRTDERSRPCNPGSHSARHQALPRRDRPRVCPPICAITSPTVA